VAERRIVLDSNVWISGILWTGIPHRIIGLVESGRADAFATTAILDEIRDAVMRPKFARRLQELQSSPQEVMGALVGMVQVVEAGSIDRVIREDPDDDRILACALTADAHFVVSGDRHVLALRTYRDIRILTPNEFWHEARLWVR
jgi:uncharacterized protein